MEALKPHRYAALFPALPQAELEALAENIAAEGLNDDIIVFEGQILDGIHRDAACRLAGVEPRYVEWTPGKGTNPLEFVISRNLHRRHLDPAQRAVLALELVEEQQKLGVSTGEAVATAAEVVQTPARAVDRARRVQKLSPELVDQVRTGKMSLAEAERLATAAEEQRRADEAARDKALQKEKTDMQNVLQRLGGKGFADAVIGGTLLKDPDEWVAFLALPDHERRQIVPLISRHWKVMKSVKLMRDDITERDTLEHLIAKVLASPQKRAEIVLCGVSITAVYVKETAKE